MKTHVIYLTIIAVLIIGGVIHFIHHLEVEHKLEDMEKQHIVAKYA